MPVFKKGEFKCCADKNMMCLNKKRKANHSDEGGGNKGGKGKIKRRNHQLSPPQ